MPAFADNYLRMLQDGSRAIVVDPGDAKPVFDALASNRLQLAAILVTHHHDDRSREATAIAAVREHTGLAAHASEPAVFAALREWKNSFQ